MVEAKGHEGAKRGQESLRENVRQRIAIEIGESQRSPAHEAEWGQEFTLKAKRPVALIEVDDDGIRRGVAHDDVRKSISVQVCGCDEIGLDFRLQVQAIAEGAIPD